MVWGFSTFGCAGYLVRRCDDGAECLFSAACVSDSICCRDAMKEPVDPMSRGACISDKPSKKEPEPMPATPIGAKGDVAGSDPGDIFVDESTGRLWRVQTVWPEPSVQMVEVEPPQDVSGVGSTILDHRGFQVRPLQKTMMGTISARMWTDFRRIWRSSDKTATPTD